MKQGFVVLQNDVSGLVKLNRKGYVASMYKQYGKVISPMGCRAFLSPWYERGGIYPADSNDVPVFVGRFNIGAVSLHLPMIWQNQDRRVRIFMKCWIII